MTTTEQQAGATEREAVEKLSEWLWPNCDRHFLEDGTAFITPTDAGPDDLDVYFAPFTAEGERELLNAVQNRWGRPALTTGDPVVWDRWFRFRSHRINSAHARAHPNASWWGESLDLVLSFEETGDVAWAVIATLEHHPE